MKKLAETTHFLLTADSYAPKAAHCLTTYLSIACLPLKVALLDLPGLRFLYKTKDIQLRFMQGRVGDEFVGV